MSLILTKAFRKSFALTENCPDNKFMSGVNGFKKFICKLFSMDTKDIKVEEMKDRIRNKFNVTFEEIPMKSMNDKKEYLVMKLENGLKALLVSDVENLLHPEDEIDTHDDTVVSNKTDVCKNYKKDTLKSSILGKKMVKKEKLAACSLTLGVGSFSDPEKIPGLAHFLEHMLFMGSEKFPKENDFDSYITKRGGFSNAFTDNETTSFYFTCPDRHLCRIMERFANFFISPLMKKDSMSREREAVDSEFQQNLSSDSARVDHILNSTAVSENPGRKFSWGNLITLKQNVTDNELFSTLREFWESYYTANLMTVAIQARFPLDVLGIWAAEYFGEIKSNNRTPITFPYVDPPFEMDLFNKIYTIMPVGDLDHLILTWGFPSVKHLYKSKPLSYLIFLVGHKGEGSLFSYLHEKLWIIDLNVCCRNTENNSVFSTFSVDFILTDKGLQHYEEIIALLFAYIELLNHEGPSKSVFRESQIVNDLEFRFQYESEASDYVQELSRNMQVYPPIHYITGDKLLLEFKPEEITNALQRITPETVNIMILSQAAAEDATLDQTEKWFKTKYTSENIPENLMHKWKNCESKSELHLPKPNIYIPEDFSIVPCLEEPPEYPTHIIKNNKYIEVWYKPDSKFHLPYGYVAVYLVSPITSLTPENSVMCDIFQWLLGYLIVKESYPASLAGLDFSVTSGYAGLILTIEGFSHKISLLLETVLKKVISYIRDKNIPEGIFEAIKEQLKKDYYNSTLDPSGLSREIFLSILCTHFWDSNNELEAIHNITLEKCQEFNAHFFENLYIKCLIQGNLSEQQAIDISNFIKKIIDYKPLSTGTYPQLRTRALPLGESAIRVQSFSTLDTNCNVTNYYQCGPCHMHDRCLLLLLMFIMEEPLFNTLRTQEQLAYSTNCQFKDVRGILGFTITVSFQADKFTVDHVENRMTLFFKKFIADVENMTDEDFNRNKESIKTLLLLEDTNLEDEFRRNLGEIITDEYMFDRIKKEVRSIEKIKLIYLKDVLKKVFSFTKTDKPAIGKLSIQVDGKRELINKNERKWEVADKSHTTNDQKTELTGKSDARDFCKDPEIYNVMSTSNANHSFQIKIPENKSENVKFIKNIEQFKSRMFIYPYTRHIKD